MKKSIVQFRKIQKNLFVVFLVLISAKASSQITLEHSYPNGRYKVSIVELSNSGKKYQWVNTSTGELKLYNLDHSLFKSMNFPLASAGQSSVFVYYTSESTFALDSKIEYMVYYLNDINQTNSETKIINEDGTILFSKTGESPTRYADKETAIHNTINGTKMILDSHNDSTAKIYSLPGTLIATNINKYEFEEDDFLMYPNPARNIIKLAYSLPQNVKEATMTIYNSNGAIINKFNIDSNYREILVNTDNYIDGIYYCQVNINNIKASSTKFVIKK